MNIYDVAELQQYLNPEQRENINYFNFDPSQNYPNVAKGKFDIYDPAYGDLFYSNQPNMGIFSFRNSQMIPSFGGVSGYRNTGGIMDIEPAVNNVKTRTLDLQSLPANMGVANEPDVEQAQSMDEEKSGIAKLFEFLQKFSPINALKGLGSLLDFRDSPNYIPAPMGVYGYTPEQLDKMNALGGYYSDPMRTYRRNTQRISNMLQRAAAGKSYSQKNLDTLMNQVGLGDVDTGGMIDSIAQSGNIGYGIGETGRAPTPDRDYSSSPGALAGDMEYGEE